MKIIILPLIFILTISCSGLGEAKKVLQNQKMRTTDEFLVKKKDPLEMPPDFEKIPRPDSQKKSKNQSKDEAETIKEILKAGEQTAQSNISENSTEKAILKRIRK
jgi:hypothetical protein|tara:strand:+ start:58 stop:372 length:315 start_codon:yes stop_codon:yes gene_type:complete